MFGALNSKTNDSKVFKLGLELGLYQFGYPTSEWFCVEGSKVNVRVTAWLEFRIRIRM